MLDLIVLGQVPGTQIQLGFTDVFTVVGSLLCLYELARIAGRNLRQARLLKAVPNFDEIAL